MGKLLERTCNHWSADSVRLICPPCVLAKDTFLYLQEIGYFKTEPPYSVERANLPSFLIIYTLSGSGVLETDGRQTVLGPGSCLFLDCMQHHCYYTPDGGSWEFLWAHFYGSGSMGYYRLFSEHAIHSVQLGEDAALQELFQQMIRRQQNWKVHDEISNHADLVTILSRILLACSHMDPSESGMPDYIRRAAREVERNCTCGFSLHAMAERYGVSRFHFSRAFKQHMGMNFSEYVIYVRLRQAKELLRYTDDPVAEVASACGMPDVSYFIRLFRQREGITPLTYRKQWGDTPRSE